MKIATVLGIRAMKEENSSSSLITYSSFANLIASSTAGARMKLKRLPSPPTWGSECAVLQSLESLQNLKAVGVHHFRQTRFVCYQPIIVNVVSDCARARIEPLSMELSSSFSLNDSPGACNNRYRLTEVNAPPASEMEFGRSHRDLPKWELSDRARERNTRHSEVETGPDPRATLP